MFKKKNQPIMKRLLFIILLLMVMPLNAQDFDGILNGVRVAEARAALSRMQYRASMNTGNYDIKYNRLEFNVDPSAAFISGNVTAYYEAKAAMDEITFDLAGNMTVTQVLQRGNPLAFVQNTNEELVITLAETLNTGVLDSLTVTYSGNPVSSGFGSFEVSTHNGKPILWTLSEPYGAKGWWPCKQDLIDKIDSLDVYITTPQFNPTGDEYIAVANGLEQSQSISGGSKTTHFKHRYPIPAYLIAIAVTNYAVYVDEVENNGNPFEIVNYVYPENLVSAQASTPVTVDIMNLFTELFEEYPFANEKYGHAQFGWGGGMEHTTVSFMGSFSRNLIAHELAHQWFGNKITCGSWKDIWLNEGFATYLSGLVIEDLDGNDAFRTWKQQRTTNITSAVDGAVYLTDADTTNVNRIFNNRLSYNKGAMVLHMLRKKLGDEMFYQGLRNYLAAPNLAYGYAKTEDFIPIIEAVSGEDLTEFFSDWLYNQGYPTYNIGWFQPNANQVNITINQTQSHASVSFFEAGVPLRFLGTSGQTLDVTLDNSQNNQHFDVPVTFEVSEIVFDPEADLISRDSTVSLGMDDVDFDNRFLMYPNPARQTVALQKPGHISVSSVDIFNALGQLVQTTAWSNTIDVSSLPAGVFIVRFQTGKGAITKSLLKN